MKNALWVFGPIKISSQKRNKNRYHQVLGETSFVSFDTIKIIVSWLAIINYYEDESFLSTECIYKTMTFGKTFLKSQGSCN